VRELYLSFYFSFVNGRRDIRLISEREREGEGGREGG
jgi:hypothetical protein